MSLFSNPIKTVGVRGSLGKLSILIGTFIAFMYAMGFVVISTLNASPSSFPVGSDFVIEDGMSVREIGTSLKEHGLIRSSLLFRFLIKGSYEDIVIQAGSYRFERAYKTEEIIQALEDGTSRSPETVVTFPEGFSVYNIREYTKDVFTEIPLDSLIQYEGFLFPDTYFVAKGETLTELIERMREEYDVKIEPYRERITASGFTEREVIILASILEREANDEASMRLVSGILQNRLANDLPLQVDATFEYILGKTSAELTLDDLALDSPYNTYLYRGLPPTPIANPGLLAIDAVLSPTQSEYYYYLTGNDGAFYYAETFEEHKRNKEKYLR
jgi:UPF0755 protein